MSVAQEPMLNPAAIGWINLGAIGLATGVLSRPIEDPALNFAGAAAGFLLLGLAFVGVHKSTKPAEGDTA